MLRDYNTTSKHFRNFEEVNRILNGLQEFQLILDDVK